MKTNNKPKKCKINTQKVALLESKAVEVTKSKLGNQANKPDVGAAVLGSDEEIYTGAYIRGSTCYTTIHAEMAAVSNAICSGSSFIGAIAIYFRFNNSENKLQPCGNCLQFLADNSLEDIWIITSNNIEKEWSWNLLSELLPHPWS